jgi:hypothetical protein
MRNPIVILLCRHRRFVPVGRWKGIRFGSRQEKWAVSLVIAGSLCRNPSPYRVASRESPLYHRQGGTLLLAWRLNVSVESEVSPDIFAVMLSTLTRCPFQL